MNRDDTQALHDAYAADYDAQVAAYDCHIAELLFGLTYEYTAPGRQLLDAGIGSGLSSEMFAKAGLAIHGMDFSPAMLAIAAAKGFVPRLIQRDLRQTPWPYATGAFDHVVCCGVLHFVAELDAIFCEASRALRPGGTFAFTTRAAAAPEEPDGHYERETAGPFDIYSHTPAYINELITCHDFVRRKMQRCLVGEDQFILWVAEKQSR